jgi:hypothetical protein
MELVSRPYSIIPCIKGQRGFSLFLMVDWGAPEYGRLTSSVLCQHEDRAHSQVYVLIHEYRIEDPLDARSVTEHPHRTCSPSYFPEAALKRISRADRFAKVSVIELKTGEQILKVVLETPDRFRAFVSP